jgi:hypothetical protein
MAASAPVAAGDGRGRAEVELFEGECHAAMGNSVASEAAFRRALQADPEITLDPRVSAADVVERLDRVRRSLHGTLVVSAAGLATRVRIDGQDSGAVPLRGQLTVGRHEVAVATADPGSPLVRTVVIRQDETLEVAFPLATQGSASSSRSSLEGSSGLLAISATALGAVAVIGGGVAALFLVQDRGTEVGWSNGSYAGATPQASVVSATRQRVTIEAVVSPALAVVGTVALAYGIHRLLGTDAADASPAPVAASEGAGRP